MSIITKSKHLHRSMQQVTNIIFVFKKYTLNILAKGEMVGKSRQVFN